MVAGIEIKNEKDFQKAEREIARVYTERLIEMKGLNIPKNKDVRSLIEYMFRLAFEYGGMAQLEKTFNNPTFTKK